jgi:hypothetical protein
MLAVPNTSSNSSDEMYYLTAEDQGYLRALIDWARKNFERGTDRDPEPQIIQSPEVLIVKIPTTGIAAFDFTTMKPGKEQCEVWKITPTDELNPFTADSTLSIVQIEGLDPTQEWIFNIYPVKWYGVSTKDTFARATRDRFGRWLIEKPEYTLKAKTKVDITPNNKGKATVYINGVALTADDDIEVWLDWMHSNKKVSATKQIVVKYFPDQRKFVIQLADCEDMV